jgi:type IV secretory pathway TraG/TraD family ATPase VirD4
MTRHPDMHRIGVSIGRDARTNIELWASLEDSWLIVGPPRVGKDTTLLIPTITHWPGPLAITSNRPDTMHATLPSRQAVGPVVGFDPQGLTKGVAMLRWSPIRGCENPATAIIRGRALATGAGHDPGRNPHADFWQAQTAAVLRCYLHAAAVGGLSAGDLLRWAHTPQAQQPQHLLRHHGEVTAWADELTNQATADPRMRDDVWAGVRRALDSLADPAVLNACTPPQDATPFDPRPFLEDRGTLYLLGDTGAQLSVAPLITALVEDVVDTARHLADDTPDGHLDPPLGLILNEAANICPLPSLPSLVATGGGRGIPAFVVLQSLNQARHRWGEAQADSLWDAANIKLIYGGLAHAEDLQRISHLAGDIDQPTHTRTHPSAGNPGGWTTSQRRVPVLGIETIRHLPRDHAILLYRHLPPTITRLTPYWQQLQRRTRS